MNNNEEISPSRRNWRWLLWVVAGIVLVADQWSKTQIINWLAIGESWRPYAGTPILEWFAFTHTKNSGAAFGIFPTGGWFFVGVAIVVSLGIIWYYPRLPREKWWLFLSLGLQLGGALGNLIDRLRIGWVTDFVHIGVFAIFNIADAAIVSGVLILAAHLYLEDKAREEQMAAELARNEDTLTEFHVTELKKARGARVYDAPPNGWHSNSNAHKSEPIRPASLSDPALSRVEETVSPASES